MAKNVVIVVPHGDDEVLGFGGIIQKHVKNFDDVYLIFVRKPIDERTKKQYRAITKAKEILKYKDVFCLQMTEVELSHEPLTFFRRLEDLLFKLQPEIVYTTFWADIHQDHKITFDWVCRAVRIHGPLNVKEFYVGEIPSSTDQRPYIIGDNFKPNYYVRLTEEEVNLKVEAVNCYLTEICEYPHPRSSEGIMTKAKIRGQECGTFYAEALMCLRCIR
jgi:LmbE family N-acetylglucosaminyl deacetylase